MKNREGIPHRNMACLEKGGQASKASCLQQQAGPLQAGSHLPEQGHPHWRQTFPNHLPTPDRSIAAYFKWGYLGTDTAWLKFRALYKMGFFLILISPPFSVCPFTRQTLYRQTAVCRSLGSIRLHSVGWKHGNART